MDLGFLVRVFQRRWWIVIPVLAITVATTYLFTSAQAPVYRSKATFVLKLSPAFSGDRSFASALDILSRRVEIAATYGEVATSRLIKQQAADELNLAPEQRNDLTVSSRALGGTNVLEITVEGTDPLLVRDFTNAVGDKTSSYVQGLYETYELQPLDRASVRNTPVAPNTGLNLALATALGLVLGIGYALLLELLPRQHEKVANFHVLDDETGTYSKRYFVLRLEQEIHRARRQAVPLTVALLNVDLLNVLSRTAAQERRHLLQRAAQHLAPNLREEDIMARFGTTVFAFLLPGLSEATVTEILDDLQTRLTASPLDPDLASDALALHTVAGMAALDSDQMQPEDLLAKAAQALKVAEASAMEQIELFTGSSAQQQRSDAQAGALW